MDIEEVSSFLISIGVEFAKPDDVKKRGIELEQYFGISTGCD